MSQTIYIKTIYNTTISIQVSNADTTDYLKSKIQDIIGVHPDCQYLYYNNELIQDNNFLSNYKIIPNDTIIQYDRIKK